MTLDLWCLVLVTTFALTGAAQGASGQLARLLALLGATLAGFLGGPTCGTLFFRSFPPSARETLAGLLVGFVAYLLLSWTFRSLFRRVVAAAAWGKSDRWFGGLLGGLQGVYLAWVFVTVVPFVNLALASRGSHWRFHDGGSWSARFVARHPFGLGPAKEIAKDASLKKTIDNFQKLALPTH